MVRLTFDLLQNAPQSISPGKDRQILLRGHKIPAIENLGATQDHFDCIDLSDNDLIKLANIPPLKRLRTLIVANNRIARLAGDAFENLPMLSTLVLTNNRLTMLLDLEPIFTCKNLERLSLLDNGVTKVKHYRLYMIHKCPKSLRILDFCRVKDKERKAAATLFSGEAGAALLKEIAPERSALPAAAAAGAEATQERKGPSTQVIEKIKLAIANAKTIEEVTRLEKALKSGVLPDDMKDDAEKETKPAASAAPSAVSGALAKAPPPDAPPAALPAPPVAAPAAGDAKKDDDKKDVEMKD